MNRLRNAVLLLVLVVLAAGAGPAPAAGFDRTNVLLPGALRDAVTVRLADGSPRVALLVAPVPVVAQEAEKDGEGTEAGAGEPGPGEGSGSQDAAQGAPEEGGPSPGGAGTGPDAAPDAPEQAAGADRAAAEGEAPDLPRSLVLVDPRDGSAVLLADDLPSAARKLVAVARAGRGDLLVVAPGGGEPGESLVLDPAGPLAPAAHRRSLRDVLGRGVLPDRGTVVDSGGSGDQGGRGAAAPPVLAVIRDGGLQLVGPGLGGDPGGGPVPSCTLPLPRRAERRSWGVRITSPPVHPVLREEGGDAGPCWAVGPEPHGSRRLRTLLYCTAAEASPRPGAATAAGEAATACAGAADPVEAWSLLPAGETVTETLYARHRDRHLLAILTREKLGPFVKQHLRLYPLETSRSRIGDLPVLAAETGCPLWRGSTLGFADADGDGHDDLVLVCRKGLVDPELRLEVYRGTAGGGFEEVPRDAELDGDYDDWRFGRDWTGEGLPDLLAVREGALHVHPGTGARRRPIEKRPGEIVPFAAGVTLADGEGPAAGGLEAPTILTTVELGGATALLLHRPGGTADVVTVLVPR